MRFKDLIITGLLFLPLFVLGQIDKMFVSATLDTLSKGMTVKQQIVFYNNTGRFLNSIYLHTAANSYSNAHTVLGKRKLEDRNKVLYFSKEKERGGIKDLTIFIDNKEPDFKLNNQEFYEVFLFSPLKPNDSISLELNYKIKIPFDKITGYGYSEKGDYLLKNFLIQPFNYENGEPQLEPFTDAEFNPYRETEYDISIYGANAFFTESDLENVVGERIRGRSKDAVTIFISREKTTQFQYEIGGKSILVLIGYPIDELSYNIYFGKIKRELEFLYEKTGILPSKIFITSKTKKIQNFIGADNIDLFGLKSWELFTKEERIDLRIFQQLSYNTINQLITVDKNKNHWIPNGIQTYYQYQYLKEYYSDTKLLGQLPEKLKILGVKPLKYFFVSKVPLTDRYKLGYRYIATQNYDQPISENYLELSNINQYIISGFKSGLSFNFLSEYLGNQTFETSLKNLINENQHTPITSKKLQNELQKNTKVNLDWFFTDYIKTNDRINLKIAKFYSKDSEDSLQVKIKNRTKLPVPLLISAEKDHQIKNEKWVFSNRKDSLYSFPKGDYDKLSINKGYLFPEINDNDNVLTTEGLFKNKKRIQMKFYADVDNPDYAQIFYEPKINWNDYDKFILGFRFYNSSPFSRPFEFSFSPTYSTGTNDLTGSGSFGYNYDMENGIFRRISLGGGYSYYHYDKNLSYTKYSGGMSFIFKKRPRSEISQSIGISFNSVDKETDSFRPKKNDDYSQYNLLDITYAYSDKKLINEWYGRTNFQHSNLFNKLSAEIYYRHEYAENKKITLRFFGGYFFNNKSESNYFNFGVDHISDYSFSYMHFLGRSATSGILYQQYIMAEGGFKSILNKSASRLIATVNGEVHLWKPFDLYADVGGYKNIKQPVKFIYDSGIKVRVIPDFLEIYFPLQSTLGFEPARDNYLSHLRFVFNFNIPAVINYLRRGWY